jgi:hypothetical protein
MIIMMMNSQLLRHARQHTAGQCQVNVLRSYATNTQNVKGKRKENFSSSLKNESGVGAGVCRVCSLLYKKREAGNRVVELGMM